MTATPRTTTAESLQASFQIQNPGQNEAYLELVNGPPEIRLDSDNIHIAWPDDCKRAELEFIVDESTSVNFDGVTLGLCGDNLPSAKVLPITVDCEVLLPRRVLRLNLSRDTWAADARPVYNLVLTFEKADQGLTATPTLSFDPKIYNEGPGDD